MGNIESTQEQKQKSVQFSKINHPRFQQFSNSFNSHHESCFQVKIPIDSQKQYQSWEKALQHAPNDHDNFLMPHEIHLHQHGFCGSSHYVNAFFDKFPLILSDQIKSRREVGAKGFFNQSELWYIIYTLVSAGYDFHSRGLKVGDIRSSNIFLNHQGRMKIPTFLSWPDEKVNYEKTYYQNQKTYLAPEELQDLKLLKQHSESNSSIAQSFSVGLTCLDAAILTNCTDLYLKNNCLDFNGLSINLQELKQKNYSQDLVRTITNLCKPQPETRSTCTQVYKILQPFQKQINSFTKFSLNQPSQIRRLSYKIVQTPVKAINNPEIQVGNSAKASQVKFFYSTPKSQKYNNQYALQSSIKKNQYDQKQTQPSPFKSEYSVKKVTNINQDGKRYDSYYQKYTRPQTMKNQQFRTRYQNDRAPQSLYSKQRQSAQETMSRIDQQLQWSKKMFPK